MATRIYRVEFGYAYIHALEVTQDSESECLADLQEKAANLFCSITRRKKKTVNLRISQRWHYPCGGTIESKSESGWYAVGHWNDITEARRAYRQKNQQEVA